MINVKPEGCDCCGFETDALKLFSNLSTTIGGGGGTRKEDFWYCDLCASTLASNFSRYPNQTPSGTAVMQTVCHVGNVILAAMKAHHTVSVKE